MRYYATKIKLKYGCWGSRKPEEIDQIYIHDQGWFEKGQLHDFLNNYPGTAVVNIPPYPYLIPDVSRNGEKFVRSNPDPYKHDDLMDLPKE